MHSASAGAQSTFVTVHPLPAHLLLFLAAAHSNHEE
jgi:hypothetical protein